MKKLFLSFAVMVLAFLSCEKEPVLTLSVNNISAPSVGGASCIVVNANNPWSVAGNEWCSVSPSSGEGGQVEVTINVNENITYDSRSCTLIFTSADLTQSLTVTQECNFGVVVPKNIYEITSAAQQISVEVKANVEYDINIQADWIKESGTKSLISNTCIFNIDANTTYGTRQGTIAISERDGTDVINVLVKQAQNDAIIISSKEYNLSSEAQSIEAKLQTNVDIEVITPDWISHLSTKALSDKTLVLDVKANESHSARSGEVIVRQKNSTLADTIKVNQAQEDAIILSEKEYVISCEEHTLEIKLQTNVDIEVLVPDSCEDWISHIQTKSLEEKRLAIKVDENSTYGQREGKIYIKNTQSGLEEVITITQLQNDAILLTKMNYEVSSEAQQLDATLKTNIELEIVVLENAKEWLSHIKTKSLIDKTVSFSIEENNTYDKRVGKVLVKDLNSDLADTLTITQLQKDAVLFDKTEYVVSSSAQSLEIELQANSEIDVEVPQEASKWLSYVKTKALQDKIVVFNIEENKTYSTRESDIFIINKATQVKYPVKIIQLQNDAIIVSQESYNIGSEGGNIEVEVKYNVEYDIKIDGNWVTKLHTRGLDTDKLIFSVAENDSKEPRTCPITFTTKDRLVSQQIKVIQEGKVPQIKYTSSDGQIVVPTFLTWGDANIVSNIYKDGEGAIIFDREITEIPYNAFVGKKTLTSVTIPGSITSVDRFAFRDCSNLTEFKGKFASEDGRCLIVDGDLRAFAPYGLTSYSIQQGVTSITALMEGCTLKTITIPNSVNSIDWQVFRLCKELTNFKGKFVADNGRCLIKDDELIAFACGSNLTEYNIPENVTSIGSSAFEECNLSKINIPEGVRIIGRYVFRNSKNLESITIPEKVTIIGEQAFYNCSKLVAVYSKPIVPPVVDVPCVWNILADNASDLKIYVPAASVQAYKTADDWKDYEERIVGYDFEKGEIVQPNNEIWYTSSDAKIITPRSVDFDAKIISNTYNNGKGVITFDGDVTRIGEEAFRLCSKLTSITIPNSVKTIAYEAFCYCSGLTGSMNIPESVTRIEERAFMGNNLSSFEGKFASQDGRLLVEDDVAIAFAPYGMESYTIPANIKSLGNWLIYGCHELRSLIIPDNVVKIGEYAIYNCSKFENVSIGKGVQSIGKEFCWNCPSLRHATIPANVATMGYNCFGSSSLEYLKFEPTTPPGYDCYPQTNDYFIYVPDQAYNAYCNNSSTIKEKFVVYKNIMEKIKNQPQNELWYFGSEILEPYKSSSIDAEISGCQVSGGNGVLKFENDITIIGKLAFSDAKIRAVFVPDGVKTIGDRAFGNCIYMSVIVLPESIEEIGTEAFSNYYVDHIGLYCKSITPPKIGTSILFKADNGTTNHRIYVPRASVEAYKKADGWSEYADMIVGYDFN